MKPTTKILAAAIGAVFVQAAGQVQATPTIGAEVAEISANNYEELLRPADSCSATYPCLTNDATLAAASDAYNLPPTGVTAPTVPTGWAIPDPFTGTPNILVGDVFLGVIDYSQVNNPSDGNFWQPTSTTNRLMGYFATEVTAVYLSPDDPYDANQNDFTHLDFGAVTDDPYDILDGLTGDVMLAWFVDLTNGWTPNETRDEQIASATSGTLWATFGGGVDSDPADTPDLDGFLYSHSPVGAAPTNFSGEAWLALNFIENNTGYNFDRVLNDSNETELGGIAAPPGGPCDPTAATCTDLIQTFTFEVYEQGWILGNVATRFGFSSGDDGYLYRSVPEPTSLALLGIGLLGFGLARRKRA